MHSSYTNSVVGGKSAGKQDDVRGMWTARSPVTRHEAFKQMQLVSLISIQSDDLTRGRVSWPVSSRRGQPGGTEETLQETRDTWSQVASRRADTSEQRRTLQRKTHQKWEKGKSLRKST